MPLGIGPMEIVIVMVIALLVIGPKKLPDMAKSLGGGVREFRDSMSSASTRDDDDADVVPAVGTARREAV